MDINKISAMIRTLNQIEVRGRDNMEALLGVIWALEGELQAVQAARNVMDQGKPESEHGNE